MPAVYVGIDPGQKGAIAILHGNSLRVYYTPVRTVRRKTNKKTKAGNPQVKVEISYGVRMMHAILQQVVSLKNQGIPVTVALEKQIIRGNDSRNVIFRIAEGFSVWRTLLELLDLPVQMVLPAHWKPKYVEAGAVKAVSVRACRALYPKLELALKKSEALAEAVLIADYARRRGEGKEFPSPARMTPAERQESERSAESRKRGVERYEAKIAAKVGKPRRQLSAMLKEAARPQNNKNAGGRKPRKTSSRRKK